MAITAVGLGIAVSVTQATGTATILLMLVILGVGFALFSSPNMTSIMGSVQPRHYGIASSLASTMRTMGMLTSMTIITLIFSINMGGQTVSKETQALFLGCMHLSFLIFCGLSLTGILFSTVRLRGPD